MKRWCLAVAILAARRWEGEMGRGICRGLLVAMAVAGGCCAAQMPSRLQGAPFTATKIDTIRRGGEVSTTSGLVARRSDGSTYVELAVPQGEAVSSGSIARGGIVLIFDVARHRRIELYPAEHLYSVVIDLKMTAQVWPAGTEAVQLRDGRAVGVKRTVDGGFEITSLGERQIGEVETIGSRVTNASGYSQEKWYSPEIDFDVESNVYRPEGPVDTETHVEGIKRGEPDAALFEIPAGYRLMEAKPK